MCKLNFLLLRSRTILLQVCNANASVISVASSSMLLVFHQSMSKSIRSLDNLTGDHRIVHGMPTLEGDP